MSSFIGTDVGMPFADDMRLFSDLSLVAEVADQAAQGALNSYVPEEGQRSPLERVASARPAREQRRVGGGCPSMSLTSLAAPLRR